jgi:hypothetical protein
LIETGLTDLGNYYLWMIMRLITYLFETQFDWNQVTKLPVYRSTISLQNFVSFRKIKWDEYKLIELSNLAPPTIYYA